MSESEDLTRQVLEKRLAEVEQHNQELLQMLTRPINVSMGPSAQPAWVNQLVAYLPQITNLTTNLAYVSSKIEAGHLALAGKLDNQNALLDRIARAIEHSTGKPGKPDPVDHSVGNTPGRRICRCDGPPHSYTKGWCPAGGPVP